MMGWCGYRFVTPWMGLTPYAAGQFVTFELPNYAETVVSGANTFAPGYAAKSVTATRSELGLRSDKSFAMQDAIPDLARPRRLGARLQPRPLDGGDRPCPARASW
jgi:Autotransporter beta-domain